MSEEMTKGATQIFEKIFEKERRDLTSDFLNYMMKEEHRSFSELSNILDFILEQIALLKASSVIVMDVISGAEIGSGHAGDYGEAPKRSEAILEFVRDLKRRADAKNEDVGSNTCAVPDCDGSPKHDMHEG